MSLNYLSVYKVKNFFTIKDQLIKLIFDDKYGVQHQNIFKTDYFSTVKGEWFNYFHKKVFQNFSEFFIQKYNADKIHLDNCWYQIYNTNDNHGLHMHPRTNFTNVFYLQLPGPDSPTIVKNQILNAEEGDIVSFPGFIPHESKTNIHQKPKIIISFNSSLELN
tara:strand:+ start:30 stop:518 length:489 start_codon:yes stop_codon:yes gene_type:complete